jgi:hypothetical protein
VARIRRSTVAVFILLGNMVLALLFTGGATEAERTSVDDRFAIISMAASTAFIISTEGTTALFVVRRRWRFSSSPVSGYWAACDR